MSGRIDKLVSTCFRGASSPLEIEFDKSKPFTLIFGENGTGKSTIADAIDFVANKSLGSLEDRSFGVARQPYVTTLDHAAKDCHVEINSGSEKWAACFAKQKVSVTGSLTPLRAMVLRRAQLLKLVEAEPAKRYAELQRFIDVAKVEYGEQQLRDVLRFTEKDLGEAVAILNESQTALGILWEKEGKPYGSATAWAGEKTKNDVASLKTQQSDADLAVRALDDMRRAHQSNIDAVDAVIRCANDLLAINNRIAAMPAVAGEQVADLVNLLVAAQTAIQAPKSPTACPVCEQPVIAANLRASIAQRLQSFKQATELVKQRSSAQAHYDAAVIGAKNAVTSVSKFLLRAAKLVRGLKGAPHNLGASAFSPYDGWIDDPKSAIPESSAVALREMLDPCYDSLKRHVESLQADVGKQNAIVVHYERILVNTDKAEAIQRLIARLKEALLIVETTRKDFAQGILNEVADEASKLYEIIHPNESLGSLKLLMNASKKGSIDQEASFEGKENLPPQAYFSESHLDTLGFCVWLAVARRVNPKETVIVLDDIFTSVDSVHLTRIIHLLTTIVGEFAQLIVLTHYRTWRDRYRLSQGPTMHVQLLELHRWSLSRGVRLSGTMIGIEELQQSLSTEPLNRQAIASQAGILLEALLDRLSLQYRRRLPRNRESEWTLGDLLASCKKLLSALTLERTLPSASGAVAASTPTVTIAIQPFLDDAGPLIFVRNQVGCHFNLAGAEVSDGDVRAFGEATIRFVKALACDGCGDIPDKRDGTHFRCGCKRTKMTPLEYDK